MTGSKQQVFYIHGGESFNDYDAFTEYLKIKPIRSLPGSPETKFWTRSLEEKLGEGFEVFKPSMPNADNAKYEEWKIWFERHFEYLHDGVILIGWSLGAMFFTKYLSEQKLPVAIKALLLVSPATDYFVDPATGEDGGDFNGDSLKLANLTKNAQNIVIFHSKDDFIIPYEHSLRLKETVPEAELITFDDKNHFLIEEFPELLDKIRQFAKSQ